VMFFLVEAGAPHVIREQFTMASDAASQFVTQTSVAYQFAKLVPGPGGKETAVRVDGQPFPAGPAVNEPKAPAEPADEAKAPDEAKALK
jgi:hypothetical protein